MQWRILIGDPGNVVEIVDPPVASVLFIRRQLCVEYIEFMVLLSYGSLNIAEQLRTSLIVEFDEQQAILSVAVHAQLHIIAECSGNSSPTLAGAG